MINHNPLANWRIIGTKVTGTAHKQKNKPCQDNYQLKQNHETAIIAVADGHGSLNSPLSHFGSKMAVEVAVQVCLDFSEMINSKKMNSTAIRRHAEEELPKLIVRSWAQRVEEDYRERFHNDPPLEGQPLLLKYGSTLLVMLLTETFAIFLQLGDGDILLVHEDGSVRSPIPCDERLIGNDTTSLCSPEAWKEMRTAFISNHERWPALILLASDGYSNSFKSKADFFQAGRDYLLLAKEHGIDIIESHLEEWLGEVSEKGSGDDITVCIAFQSRIKPQRSEAEVDGDAEHTDNQPSTDIQPIRE